MTTMLGDSIRRRRPRAGRARRRPDGPSLRELNWKRWTLGLVAGVLLSFSTAYAVSAYLFFPSPRSSGDGIEVPDLIGRSADDAAQELAALGLRIGEAVEIPNATHELGTVVAQSPVAGQRLPSGADVRLATSQGPPRAFVPDLVGLPAERAMALATRAGFEVTSREELSRGAPGRVLRVEPRPGTELVLPAGIAVVVSIELPTFDLDEFDLNPALPPIPRPQPRELTPRDSIAARPAPGGSP